MRRGSGAARRTKEWGGAGDALLLFHAPEHARLEGGLLVVRLLQREGPPPLSCRPPCWNTARAFCSTTKQTATLSAIARELRARARELNLEAVEITPQEVRQAVVGNPKATKIDVAEALVKQGFEELRGLVPRRPARAALGLRPKDKYWLHMFDALGLAISVNKSTMSIAVSTMRASRSVPESGSSRRPCALHGG